MSKDQDKKFAHTLFEIFDIFYNEDFDPQQYDAKVRHLFIEAGGNTLEDRKYMNLIEFGSDIDNTNPDYRQYGFRLRDQPYTYLRTFLNTLERMEVPEAVEFRDIFPDMTQDEWIAALRVCILIVSMFDLRKQDPLA